MKLWESDRTERAALEDREILDLFFQRSQRAVEEVQAKYGARLQRLAENMLGDVQDAEECVSDACLGAWNSIPPHRPEPLLPYLYKIVRNQCLKRYRRESALKRGGDGFDAAFDELENWLGFQSQDPAAELDAKELAQALDQFLKKLSRRDRILFLGRYWFGEPYSALSAKLGITENNAAVRLSRIRDKLKKYLAEKGAIE